MKDIVGTLRHTGMICPSSKYLVNKMLKKIDWKETKNIVLFGSGTGCFVKGILEQMPKDAKLFIFELNEFFVENYKIEDEKIIYFVDSAENVNKLLDNKKVDLIVSTLPFASIPKNETQKIIIEAKKALKEGGYFVQYQYFMTNLKDIKKVFGDNVELSFEFRNLPPAFIYLVKNI